MDRPIVELRQAGAVLSGSDVLCDLNWALHRGEHWAVFGANGSGKTTFLRLLAGQQWPKPGANWVRRYDFGAGPEYDAVTARQRIRFVGPELHDGYPLRRLNPSVATIIATGLQDSPILRVRLDDRQRARVAGLTQSLAIEHLIERRFLNLSRGQQRKVLIARALVSGPQVLLLDEICDGLDAPSRDSLLRFLDESCAGGLQLVFATHRRSELPATVSHFIELDRGRIVAARKLEPASPSPKRAQTHAVVRARACDAARSPLGSALISIRNGRLYRGTTRVIDDLDWRVVPGQHWLISGANGSGKSSFLKLLNGDLRPALGGNIVWFGTPNPANIWSVRRKIGLVSDELQSIYGDSISVGGCVATGFNASVGRVPKLSPRQRDAVAGALRATGTERLRERSVRQLSYGQFRRVLLARAFVQRPRVLLLDEPLSGVDTQACALIWQSIGELVDQGTQIVLASHDDDRGAHFFTHELVFANGRADERRLSST